MKKKITNFQDLIVWQMASDFSKEMSELIKTFPNIERKELSDDLLRSARSIPANISEGWGRIFPKEKISFYNIAKGSAEESSNHLIESLNNKYITFDQNKKYQKKLYIIKIKITNLIISTYKHAKISKTGDSFLEKSLLFQRSVNPAKPISNQRCICKIYSKSSPGGA